MKKIVMVWSFLLAAALVHAQRAEDRTGDWLMYTGNVKLTEKFKVQSIAQLRLYELSSNLNQVVLLVSANQKVSDHLSLGVGYGYIATETFDKEIFHNTKHENRIFEQLIYAHQVGRMQFNHRSQLEHRWINTYEGTSLFLNRVRYRLKLIVPINNQTLVANTFFVSFYNELHLNLTDMPFNQNWTYAALGYQVNKTLGLQAGYQRQFLGAGRQLGRLQLGVSISLDVRN